MSDPGIQSAIEHLYAELGKAIVLRREYIGETSMHPPALAHVSEIARAIVELGKVWRP